MLTNRPAPKATLERLHVVPDTCGVHVMPSGEVRIRPPSPTATNRFWARQTARMLVPVAATRSVQMRPSGEVRRLEPTTTNNALPWATPYKSEAQPELCPVQWVPSGDVAIAPCSPAAINSPLL